MEEPGTHTAGVSRHKPSACCGNGNACEQLLKETLA